MCVTLKSFFFFLGNVYQRKLLLILYILVSLVLLGVQVSYFLVITVGVLIICFPIALKLGRRVGLLHYLASIKGDKRLKLTNELLQGMVKRTHDTTIFLKVLPM